jgi:hypothetical protein
MSGCYTVRYTTNQQPEGAHHEEGAPFFLWGLVGEKVVSLDTLCPQGVARWYNQMTFVDGLLSFITIGIYAPRTIVVDCAGGKAYRVTPEGKVQALAEAGTEARP